MARATTPGRGLVGPTIAAIIAFSILVGLGVWQMERLAWKETLIERINARQLAPPVALPPETAWASLSPDDYDYRHVSVHGAYTAARQAYIFRGSSGRAGEGPGYQVLTPMLLDDGSVVLINRGFTPADLKATLPPPETSARTITGLMRPPEARNAFTPADRAAEDAWFTRDPIAMAKAMKLARGAPFTIDADAMPGSAYPRGGATEIDVPNNHLSYALTWFGLAAALMGVFAVFAWRRIKDPVPTR